MSALRTPRNVRRSLALLTGAAMLLAACSGGSEASDATLATTAAPTTSALPATAATTPATESSSASPTTRTTVSSTTSRSSTSTTADDSRPPITGNFPTQASSSESTYPRFPLLGTILRQGELAPDRPALVVKIDNAPPADPQSGLNEADVVIEEIVEYGITRFAAVYHSQGANPVGPIRSARTQDVDMLGALNQPLFAWSGGNPGVTKAIEDSDLVNLSSQTTPGYFRTSDRTSPHNLYANTDALWLHAAPDAPAPGGLVRYLDPGESLGRGLDMRLASGAEMRVGSLFVRWEWSPETRTYGRLQSGSVHDTTTGPVTTQNLVLLKMAYQPSPVDARSPEAQTIGEGPAVVLGGGKLIEGHWVREERTDMFFLFQGVGPEAKPIKLPPGRTFIELLDRTSPDPVIL